MNTAHHVVRTSLWAMLALSTAGLPVKPAQAAQAGTREHASMSAENLPPLQSIHLRQNHMTRTHSYQVQVYHDGDTWRMDAWFPQPKGEVRCDQVQVPQAEIDALTMWLHTHYPPVRPVETPSPKRSLLPRMGGPVLDATTGESSVRYADGYVAGKGAPAQGDGLLERLRALAQRLCGLTPR